MKYIFNVVVCYCCMLTWVGGQTISSFVFATDGQTIVAHGAISYTIGEPLVRTFDKYGYTLEEGFQRVTYVPTPVMDTFVAEPDNVVDENVAMVLTCFPNPTSDLITIDYTTSGIHDAEGFIYNALGVKVMTFKLEQNNAVQLDVSTLPSGQYLVALYDTFSASWTNQIFTILK